MGVAEAPVSNEISTPQQSSVAPVQSSDSGPDLATELKGKIAALEAKIAKLESEALVAVHGRIGQVETFLRSKYPYSGL